MNINQFITTNGLQPADAIVLRKKFMGMVDHFAIYLGNNESNQPEFVANFTKGIQIIPQKEIEEQLTKYVPERVEKFNGNYIQRRSAIERAFSKIGENNYGLFSNNCEHFKNWVHLGREVSEQVDKFGNLLTIGGVFMTLEGFNRSDNKTRNWGIGLLTFGLILKGLSEKKVVLNGK